MEVQFFPRGPWVYPPCFPRSLSMQRKCQDQVWGGQQFVVYSGQLSRMMTVADILCLSADPKFLQDPHSLVQTSPSKRATEMAGDEDGPALAAITHVAWSYGPISTKTNYRRGNFTDRKNLSPSGALPLRDFTQPL
ncbi:unnamed protein product [Pleuronectes platessa]|uniref:Uncharacterized protein n=1 Tax=Pleuronectes platessa TaxID=8262 RepID=A0A9N7YPX0_PLEPL|nr:unnamed protein product [Pleuronectes platessa]